MPFWLSDRNNTMSHSKVIRSNKSKFIIRSKFVARSQFSCSRVFLVINILLQLQQQILIRFCTFSCNSEYQCFVCEFWGKKICAAHYWMIWIRVVNGPHFEARTWSEPDPGLSPTTFIFARFRSESQIYRKPHLPNESWHVQLWGIKKRSVRV